ncbi:uncharacterized protein [Leuresthes tenuis]|uniref:uncharacterized protein n=1 Tax=Leuresthes tenuis TaxID=355514 RepID=UPI003B50EE4E
MIDLRFSCQDGNVLSASHRISAAVDTLSRELTCKRRTNASLSDGKSKEVEENLRQIVESTLKVFLDLGTNESRMNVLDVFGVQESLHLLNFSDPESITLWFSLKMAPLLPFVNQGLLIQLANQDFSCSAFQELVKSMSSVLERTPGLDGKLIYNNFIKVFLSRKNSTDPGCVSSFNDTQEWIKANLGFFFSFASIEDLQALNPNFSIAATFEKLNTTEMAQFILNAETLNDTSIIDLAFDRLEVGNALENVDVFLKQLTLNARVPELTLAVRDRCMDRTFIIIGPLLSGFNRDDYGLWFNVRLVPILGSFRPDMLRNATSGINCTNYHIVVSGIAKAFQDVPMDRRQEITNVLLNYLNQSAGVINTPVCRQENQTDVDWIKINLGPFSQFVTFSELRAFNLSQEAILDIFSPGQKAKFLLEPNNLSNETLTLVFTSLNVSLENLESFFDTFVVGVAKQNLSTAVRDTILNLTLTALGPNLPKLKAEGFKLWFQVYLPLFLPSFDERIFEIIPRSIPCNSYQEIVKGFNNVFHQLSERQTQQVFNFTLDYLRGQSSSGSSCVELDPDDRSWILNNFGRFRLHASFMDFLSLKRNFSGVEVADLLTLSQLSQLVAMPSQLNGTQDVTKVMSVINTTDFAAFFDLVSPTFEAQSANYTQEVKSAFLQAVFDRGNLSSPDVSDEDFLLWLKVRLRPLLVNISPSLVTPLFNISTNRSCNSSQEMITLLDTLQKTLSNDTRKEINKQIVLFLRGTAPLKCYSSGSFYVFLRSNFLSFGFPDLPTFLSLLPPTRESELINTFNTSDLRQFLSQPSVINNSSDICVIFNIYNNTPAFVETEAVRDDVKVAILPCLWRLALSSNNSTEVNLWFDLRLKDYLRFLNKNLISSTEVQNASCVAFQKLVFFMGNNFTYNSSEIAQADVYASIRSYLGNDSSTGSEARCYNPRDPQLNSTAWFANNIGNFVTFITLVDLNAFVPTSQISVFLEDQTNLNLFNNKAIPEDVTDFYVTQIFTFNPTFSPIKFPGFLVCSGEVPSLAYSSLNENDSIAILGNLNQFCNGTNDPEVSAALASNIKTVSQQTFINLGNASSGLTNKQITSVSLVVLVSSLPTLSSVTTWDQGQVNIIIQTITSSGFQINNAASLKLLGTLVAGVPSASFVKIPASELLNVSSSPSFVSNMLVAPRVVRQTFVRKIISVNTSPAVVVQNVPDALATEIPPFQLVFPGRDANISVINKKTWTSAQSAILFGSLEKTDFDIEQLSPSLLQGFTCRSVRRMTKRRVRRLIRSCRPRRRRAKVVLRESQLTCMYNLLSGELTQNFTDYPSDMLLYFNSQNVQKANCRSYFSALGSADFSVSSRVLNNGQKLLVNARSCLGVSGSKLSRDNVEVLGNMACTFDGSLIENSDPLVLEKLKACKDFSDNQVDSMEKLLLSGKTKYGNPTIWTLKTLKDFDDLPLYFTSSIWGRFKTSTKKKFLRSLMPKLRKRKTQKRKLKRLFKRINTLRFRRGAGCTVGNITQVTVNDDSFPFGYDQTQFDLCLDVPVLQDNLNSICEKVDDDDLQKIILKKLNQAFPSGVSDQEVQLLGSVSRAASLDDISKWNITQLDTLAALMDTDDGTWETAQSKEIITKYLNTSGNSLGSTELNAIDSNLCSLDTSTLRTISSDSIRDANPLNVESCSVEQKKILYEISNASFSSQRSSPTDFYNLIEAYLGGAPLTDVVGLSTQNISMDVDTFRGLDPNVIKGLTVTNVQGLMGDQLPDLKMFENDTVIETWINLQLQSDLDRLGLGLVSSRINSTTVAPNSTSTATPTQTTGTSAMTTAPNTETSAMTTAPNTGTSAMTTVPNTGTSAMTPVPNTGTSAMTTVPNTGTSAMTPVPNTGTSAMTPVPNTGTSAMTPVPNTGTSAMTPVPNTGTSAMTPVPNTETSAMTPVPNTGTSAMTPVPNTGTSAMTPVPNTGTSAMTTVPNSGTSATTQGDTTTSTTTLDDRTTTTEGGYTQLMLNVVVMFKLAL